MSVQAPAKVNLHLEVLGLREDGYHEILSLFQMVSLSDRITVRRQGARNAVDLSGRFSFPPGENSIMRAVALFRAHTGIQDGVAIRIEKEIPMGGGMGGGSSDAAFILQALCALFGLPGERAPSMGTHLGSDVPFFLGAPAAIVAGRGERVDPIPPRDDFTLVAVTPPCEVSTSLAYSWIDQDRANDAHQHDVPRVSSSRLMAAYVKPESEWGFFNDFDGAVFPRMPALERIRDRMRECGVREPRLTGSGATLIGLASGAEEGRECARRLSGLPALVLRPLAKVPVLTLQ